MEFENVGIDIGTKISLTELSTNGAKLLLSYKDATASIYTISSAPSA